MVFFKSKLRFSRHKYLIRNPQNRMSSRLILAAAICVTGLLYYREYTDRPNIDSNPSRIIQIDRRPIQYKEATAPNKNRRQTDFSQGYDYAEENELDSIGSCSNRNPDFVRGCVELVLRKHNQPKN